MNTWLKPNILEYEWTLFVIWINCNPNMDKYNRRSKVWDEITYPFINFNGCTVEINEWISNLISHFITGVITFHARTEVKPY